jgi:hypothetical protein
MTDVFKRLHHVYYAGGLSEAIEVLENLAEANDEVCTLAIKVFKEVGDWESLRHWINKQKESANETTRIKGSLNEDFLKLMLDYQAREPARQLQKRCTTVRDSYREDGSVFFFAESMHLTVSMLLQTLGLEDAYNNVSFG